MSRSKIVFVLSGFALAAPEAHASVGDPMCVPEVAQLGPSGALSLHFWGSRVAIHGDTALVGAFGDFPPITVEVFARAGGGWIPQAELTASGPGDAIAFGFSVAVHGDTAIVGAPQDDQLGPMAGAAYVFVRGGTSWTQQAKLLASDNGAFEEFGSAVAVDGDTVLVGARADDGDGGMTGAAYVFERAGTSWTETAILLPNAGLPGEGFGNSVALSGNTALVGIRPWQTDSHLPGAAYVFVRGDAGWAHQATLAQSDSQPYDSFGLSVALDGDTAVVGAPGSIWPVVVSGSAYVFARSGSTWTQQAKFLSTDPDGRDEFGAAVAVSGDLAVVGAPKESDEGPEKGAAFVFERYGATWSRPVVLRASDAHHHDRFGSSVGADGDALAVGIWRDADTSKAAYVFELPPPSGAAYCACAAGPCANTGDGAGCANSSGIGARLRARGTTLPDEVNLLARGAVPNQPAIFFQGDNATSFPFGDGFRCAGGNVVRITTPPIVVAADGSASFGPCFGDPTLSSLTGVVPGSGEVKRYQFWYRDPSGPCGSGFNLSDGYEIVW